MSFMNWLQRTYISLAVLTLIISLHSDQVIADSSLVPVNQQSCTSHFDRDHTWPNKVWCWSGEHRHDFTFLNCHHKGLPVKKLVYPEHYHRYPNLVSALDRASQTWYDCDYSAAYFNNAYIVCNQCDF
ncbi:uncharacterized protein PGTG_13775 [Puccinia graminis f. sp. tritici CRL 75-36-700-3]|uniref:Secreted protein n=1 Tax=Puccinia graminis f. sp. tritici (strain CRL 75-36-700-3 / race SCCL) TaxID=418459 RepID=E3KUM1_PUCGT|nr:uncharacterized protein PGTG_13775 [Puccinia graminis f. sp. tritici CRL 75-36-700-3]EFP87971.2 hypothetical protein PGTG_13775 [Puccinia graminis f. sp. tritici CRL 75-36-700-3]